MNQTTNLSLGAVLTAVEDAGLFDALCTIKTPPGTEDALGQQDLQIAHYTPVPGMVAIPCMCAPRARAASAREMKAPGFTMESNGFRVALDGYYPTIKAKQIAFITGPPFASETALEIDGVVSPSQGIYTRLECSEYSL